MRILTGIVTLALSAALQLPIHGHAMGQSRQKLALGTLSAHDFDPAYVALDKGFFSAHGLDVTITRITAVGNVPPASSPDPSTSPRPRPLRCCRARRPGLIWLRLPVPPVPTRVPPIRASSLSRVRTSRALRTWRGRKYGVSSLNSFWNLMTKKWLTLHHVSPDSVTWVEVQLPLMRDALKTHSIDAVAAVEPFRGSMMGDPAFVDVSDYPAEVNPTVVESVWMAGRDWAAAHQSQVRAFKAAMSEANEFIAKQPDEARAVIATHWNVPASSFPTYFITILPEDLAFFVSLTKEFGVIDTVPNVAGLIASN